MNWTNEKPTAPGWYWYKNPAHGHDAEKDADIIDIDPVEDEALFPGEYASRLLSMLTGEFAGPIPKPGAEQTVYVVLTEFGDCDGEDIRAIFHVPQLAEKEAERLRALPMVGLPHLRKFSEVTVKPWKVSESLGSPANSSAMKNKEDQIQRWKAAVETGHRASGLLADLITDVAHMNCLNSEPGGACGQCIVCAAIEYRMRFSV